jgi:hypothetical protein
MPAARAAKREGIDHAEQDRPFWPYDEGWTPIMSAIRIERRSATNPCTGGFGYIDLMSQISLRMNFRREQYGPD